MKIKFLILSLALMSACPVFAMEAPLTPVDTVAAQELVVDLRLIEAAQAGDLERVQLAIAQGIDVNALDDKNETAIFKAVSNYLKTKNESEKDTYFAIIKILINAHANPLWNGNTWGQGNIELSGMNYLLATNARDQRLLNLIKPRIDTILRFYNEIKSNLQDWTTTCGESYFENFTTEERNKAQTLNAGFAPKVIAFYKDPENCNRDQFRKELIILLVQLIKLKKPSEQLKKEVQEIAESFYKIESHLDVLNLTSEQIKMLQGLIEIWKGYEASPELEVTIDLLAKIDFFSLIIESVNKIQEMNTQIQKNPDLANKYPTTQKLGKQIVTQWFFNCAFIGHLRLASDCLDYYDINPNSKKARNATQKDPLAHAIKYNDIDMVQLLLKHGVQINRTDVNYFELAKDKSEILALLQAYSSVSDQDIYDMRYILYTMRPLLTVDCFAYDNRPRAEEILTYFNKLKKKSRIHTDNPVPHYFYRLKAKVKQTKKALCGLTQKVSNEDIKIFENKISYLKQLITLPKLGLSPDIEIMIAQEQEIENIQKQVEQLEHMYVPNFTQRYMQKRVLRYLDGQTTRLTTLNNMENIPFEKACQLDINFKNDQGTSDLMQASTNCDVARVKLLLAKGAQVNLQDTIGASALMKATLKGNLSIVEMLLQAGALVNLQSDTGTTALLSAADFNHVQIAQKLIAAGANVNIQEWQSGYRPLYMACLGNNVQLVECLLKAGAQANISTDVRGVTPLHLAVSKNNIEIVRLLLNADRQQNPHCNPENMLVNRCTEKGETALIFATHANSLELVDLLLEAGAMPNLASITRGTALHLAVAHSNKEMVQKLINAKADVNFANDNNQYPLRIAVAENNVKIITLLLDAGANPNCKPNKFQESILMQTISQKKNNEIIFKLIDAGADVNAVSSDGNTPLLLATTLGDSQLVQKLLAKGARANVTHSNECTPLITAITTGNLEIIKLIINSVTDKSILNVPGKSLLRKAQDLKTANKLAIIKFLRKNSIQ